MVWQQHLIVLHVKNQCPNLKCLYLPLFCLYLQNRILILAGIDIAELIKAIDQSKYVQRPTDSITEFPPNHDVTEHVTLWVDGFVNTAWS
ncbi:hypothetical protein CEXT_190761 [Caerostris extrusa]|uniref:Uncharacterized protein n=1 Tax=Caerostris extrusa TaxID=172846 RepID=A0AAV4VVX3_CAEEX|nr:hypothetical protein CEXT_190761 [Caerostris extrusa]